jgi:hypothetical protein
MSTGGKCPMLHACRVGVERSSAGFGLEELTSVTPQRVEPWFLARAKLSLRCDFLPRYYPHHIHTHNIATARAFTTPILALLCL